MDTSVLIILSLLKLQGYYVSSYNYCRNNIVGRLEDKDRMICAPFTFHHNLGTTCGLKYKDKASRVPFALHLFYGPHTYLNIVDKN